VTLFAWSNL